MGMSRTATRKLLVALAGGALLAGVTASAASAQLPSTTDPRAGLAPGCDNAGVAQRGIELLAHRDKPPGFSNPANPGDFAFVNSDMAFQGNSRSSAASTASRSTTSRTRRRRRSTAVVCPGGQGDVSVYGNLLFMSVEETRAKKDCTLNRRPPTRRALPRRPHLRHLQHRRAGAGRRRSRPAAARTRTRWSRARTSADNGLHLRLGHVGHDPRSDRDLTGCDAGPATNPNPSQWRIEVIRVPLAAPQTAAIVNEPRLFRDETTGARQRPAERAADAAAPVRARAWGPTAGHELLPRHHGLREARHRRRRLRGQRPADRHLRPGEPESASTPSPTRCSRTGTARRSPTTARRSSSPTSGAAARRALPRDRPAELGRERDLRDRQPQARVPQLLQAAGRRRPPRRTASATSRRWCRSPAVTSSSRPGTRAALARRLHRPERSRRRSATTTAARSARTDARRSAASGRPTGTTARSTARRSRAAWTRSTLTPTADLTRDEIGTAESAQQARALQRAEQQPFTYARPVNGSVGGNVPATLSLTLGAPAQFGAVHAGRGADVRGLDPGHRDLDRGRRAAERGRPELAEHRAPGQRHVLPAAAAAGAGAQRRQHRHGVQQRRALGLAAEPADLDTAPITNEQVTLGSASASTPTTRSGRARTARR